jgi:hypothetical protein
VIGNFEIALLASACEEKNTVLTLRKLNAALYLTYCGEFPIRNHAQREVSKRADLLKSMSQLHAFINETLSSEKRVEVAKNFRIRGKHDAKLKLDPLKGINHMLQKRDNLRAWKQKALSDNREVERAGKFPDAKAVSLKYVQIPENDTHLRFWRGI